MEISVEGLLALIGCVAGATMWIVSAIHSVRDSIKDLANDLRGDIDKHETKLGEVDKEMDDIEERLLILEKNQ